MPNLREALRRPGPDAEYGDGDDATWLGIDWPAFTRRVPVLGSEVSVVDSGRTVWTAPLQERPPARERPALVFVHGLSGNWQNWLYQMPAFSRTHRVIALDLPGFGESPMPTEPVSISFYGRVVDGLLHRLGVDRATLVGNSMGGFVAAEVALAFATRVDRLVLVSAAGLSVEHQRRQPLMSLARITAAGGTRLAAHNESVVRRRRLRRVALQSVFRYPEALSPFMVWENLQGSYKPGFLPALEALLSYAFRDRLARIECPTLIVWGRNDRLVPVRDAEEFERLIGSHARKVVWDETGHCAMVERPGRFNALLSEFLDAPATRPAPDSVAPARPPSAV